MKKSIFTAALLGVMLLSGCSGVSQEGGSAPLAESTKSESISSSSSNDSVVSSIPTEIDKDQEKFNHKCKTILEQMNAFSGEFSYSVQIDESSLQYDDNDICLSKIYVAKASGNGEDDRFLLAFLDIYSEDEYQYFQSAKNFINFIDENVMEISGRDQYMIAINSTVNRTIDISISRSTNGVDITYGNRSIHSAYSGRLKSMDLFKDSDEQIAITGLLRFDDLPKNSVSYDITCEYQGKALTHKWYRLENGKDNIVFVTYIDDGTYNNISDEDLIYYAYNSIPNPQNEIEPYSYSSYDFYIAFKSGEEAAALIHYNPSEIFRKYSYAEWMGQYEHLNSNPLNVKMLAELKGESE